MAHQVKKIALLQPALSSYSLACMKQLKARHDIELLLFHWKPLSEAPYEFDTLNWVDHVYVRDGRSLQEILDLICAFNPDGVFIPGWIDRGYMKVARQLKQRNFPVIAGFDSQWTGSLKQRLGIIASPGYLHPAIDVLWVAGERQAQLAAKFGYRDEQCWRGYYCCDWEKFAVSSPPNVSNRTNSFLYLGRYVVEKGIEDLIAAYQIYRQQVEVPWELHCIGTGNLKSLLDNQQGVVVSDFVQPDSLPIMMRQHQAFILPSRREPWGVVLQEAAAVRLPLIASDACGASVHLLQDGYNGFLFSPGDANGLSRCMIKMTQESEDTRLKMGERSYELSKQFTPQRWADTLFNGLQHRSWKNHKQ